MSRRLSQHKTQIPPCGNVDKIIDVFQLNEARVSTWLLLKPWRWSVRTCQRRSTSSGATAKA